MASNRLGMGPWDYIVGGLVLAPAAGLLALVDLTLVAWLTMFLAASLWRSGPSRRASAWACTPTATTSRPGGSRTTRPEPAALRPAG